MQYIVKFGGNETDPLNFNVAWGVAHVQNMVHTIKPHVYPRAVVCHSDKEPTNHYEDFITEDVFHTVLSFAEVNGFDTVLAAVTHLYEYFGIEPMDNKGVLFMTEIFYLMDEIGKIVGKPIPNGYSNLMLQIKSGPTWINCDYVTSYDQAQLVYGMHLSLGRVVRVIQQYWR